MRISDWSSDVCSSDLLHRSEGQRLPRGRGGGALSARLCRQPRHHDVGGAQDRREDRAPYEPGSRRITFDATTQKRYIQDVTLRDGMHAIRHQYGLDHVQTIARALDRAKVDAIEVAHGDGLQGSSFNYGFGAHTDWEWIGTVAEVLEHSVLTTLLLPGIGTVQALKRAYDLGVRSVRIAPHCTEADVSTQHIEAARGLGDRQSVVWGKRVSVGVDL